MWMDIILMADFTHFFGSQMTKSSFKGNGSMMYVDS